MQIKRSCQPSYGGGDRRQMPSAGLQPRLPGFEISERPPVTRHVNWIQAAH